MPSSPSYSIHSRKILLSLTISFEMPKLEFIRKRIAWIAQRHVQYSWSEFSVFSFVDIFRLVLGISKFSPIWQSAVVTMASTISGCENSVRCLYKMPSLQIPNRLQTNCSMQFDKQLQITWLWWIIWVSNASLKVRCISQLSSETFNIYEF